MCRRPRSSTCIATLKPSPSSPSRSSGRHARRSRRLTSQMWAPCWPIFFSGLPTVSPGRSRGTRKAETPPRPSCPDRCGPSRVNSPALLALVMKRLVPSSDIDVAVARRRVCTDGGVRAGLGLGQRESSTISPDASLGSHFAFCSSVPNMTRPWLPMPTLVPNDGAERRARCGRARPPPAPRPPSTGRGRRIPRGSRGRRGRAPSSRRPSRREWRRPRRPWPRAAAALAHEAAHRLDQLDRGFQRREAWPFPLG